MLFFTSSSPNPESSSSSKPEWIHEVFLASATVCYAVGSLQSPLTDVAIKGYVDEYELTEGLLYPAIKKSRTVVVVFTKEFVDAPLSLKIFEEIMRCQKSKKKVVLGVFWSDYDGREELLRVVRFEEAFGRLVAGNGEELRWTTAAAGATVKYSWELSISTARGSKQMEHIFYFIKNKVDGRDLVLPRRRVGVQLRVEEILRHLFKLNSEENHYIESSGNDVKIIGIWGIGGIGKTTVARAIYNLIRHHFLSASFLASIKNVWEQDNGQIHLQKQLISDVSNEEFEEIHDTEMGIRRLKMALRDKKALVILDDVSEIDQLMALCGNREWFGSRSLIVITTRNKYLLDHFKVEYVYEMKKLDEGESLMLFNAHAFNRSSPTNDFMDLSRNAITSCEGLPLALKVLGSLFNNWTIPQWKSVLEKLKGIPNGQIQEKLKISYDFLADSEKDLFINIACFYVGKSKHYVTQTLHSSKLIDVLIERSLVRIDMNDKLDVHDLLQEIAWGTNPNKPEPKYLYDVFISFRGQDTRQSFATHLYTALKQAGIEVFMDPGIKRGENISSSLLQAIENSRISIIIFSTNYAGSKWCLQELEKIMECHKTRGQVVLPIFYRVQPSEVRKQTNTFGKALDARILASKEKKLSWKKALTEAANLSGCHLEGYSTETELIEDILETIAMKIDDNTNLLVAQHPVGLTTRVQDIIQLVNNKSNEVIIVGIWGMGGIGKTTIAKAIYNKIGQNFEGKSFLANIRRVWEQDNGQVYLQEQLLSSIFKTRRVALPSIELGKTIMKERLCHKRVLVVLDDVNNVDQLNALFGSREWFGQGSIIIITTRDEHLLKILQPVQICNVKEMDIIESLKLFSWHAFKQAMPKTDFVELSRRVVSYSGGLPLALEILGSYLFDRPMPAWESVLKKLQEIPNDQMHEKLRICYDGLSDHTEKEIFLDICCFFIGKDKNYVTQILNGCGLHAEIGITRLIELSLVKVDKNNKLGMHDLLRDMGREIIREMSQEEPEKRTRLWFLDDVLDVLRNHTGTIATKGLALNLSIHNTLDLSTKAFKNMKRLRLLQLDHVKLDGDYKYLSKELRWLCWHGFPEENMPMDFSQENIVAMNLKYSNLTRVWKKSQLLERLKFLNLSHSHELTQTPDFSKLPNLEKLILKDCSRLSMVHPTIGDLKYLILLNLKDCKDLNHLPRSIYNLKSLKTLNISGCSKIDKLEENIGQMESLTTLVANQIAITQVPSSLGRLKSIKYLSLCGYEGLSSDVLRSLIWSPTLPTNNAKSLFQTFGNMSHLLQSLSHHFSFKNSAIMETRPSTSHQGSCRKTPTSINAPEQVHFTGLETFQSSLTIQLGRVNKVIDTLLNSISQGWSDRGFDGHSLPGDNYPYWLNFQGEGSSVLFEVPQVTGSSLKGLILCVFYLSPQDSVTSVYPIGVLISNRTKATIEFYKRDAATTCDDGDNWHKIISNLEPGNKVEVKVTFACEFIVKKLLIYLVYANEDVDKRIMY